MRRLASIREIAEIKPIIGADAIESALIDGWSVVVKKGEFSVGDKVVYFEIDSFIPTEIAPFLTKSGHCPKVFNGVEGERLRTIKLRGQISQGLVLPLATFSANIDQAIDGDLTDVLKIQKWEPSIPAQLAGLMRGNFPSFLRKTDQERIQNIVHRVFDGGENEDSFYEITTKLDGSSMTVYVNDGQVGVCSRNLDLKLDQEGNSFVDTAKRLNLLSTLVNWGKNIAIQGELMGEGIQGNREGIKGEHLFFVFDIWDIDAQVYYAPDRVRSICKDLGLLHVPVLHPAARLRDVGVVDLESILVFAEGPSIANPIREGLVFKRIDGGFSFKAISNKFLLRGGE